MYLSSLRCLTGAPIFSFGKKVLDRSPYNKSHQLIDTSLFQRGILPSIRSEKARKFSYQVGFSEERLSLEIKKATPIYNDFLNLDNTKKAEVILEGLVNRLLTTIKLDHYCRSAFSDKWLLLQKITQNQANISPGFPLLPDFKIHDILNGTDQNTLPILLSLQPGVFHYKQNAALKNSTEELWSTKAPTFPFTVYGPSHESVIAIEKLILPALTNHAVVREIGCWNGESLIRLAFAASERNIRLGGLFGEDINVPALQMGMALLNQLQIENITLGFGNVKDESFFTHTMSDRQQMILAFRLVSVLDEPTIHLLFSNLQKNTKRGDLLCFSYALPSGTSFENALEIVGTGKLKKEAHAKADGLTIYYGDSIFQTYFSSEGFQEVLHKYQFQQVDSQQVDDRMVSLLKKIS
jgi:hypothetical protein